jgi:citrate lyase subunit beta/citryl-CoA lyase
MLRCQRSDLNSEMSEPLHPRLALFGAEALPSTLAACEHYAGSAKLIAKALELQAEMGPLFDVTADCEDGAQAGRELEQARMAAAAVLGADNLHGRVGARIHDPAHPAWRQDVEVIVGEAAQRLAYVTIPKAGGVDELIEVIETVQELARRSGRAAPVPLHVLIESQGALRQVWEIAALPHVEVLDFGLMDWVSDHLGAIPASAMRSPGQFEHHLVVRAKAEIAAAAAAHRIVAAHNVCTELRDPAVVREDARRARAEFGFQRMWSIHPMQIRPIVEAMQPDPAEVADACAILLAAQAASWGPIRHDGRLHDRASYRYYWTVLERAHATGQTLAPPAQQAFFGT